jgi:hypothetical protein
LSNKYLQLIKGLKASSSLLKKGVPSGIEVVGEVKDILPVQSTKGYFKTCVFVSP